jgi:hypothetical protein
MGVKALNFYATFLFSDGGADFARACMAMTLSYLGIICWSRGAPEARGVIQTRSAQYGADAVDIMRHADTIVPSGLIKVMVSKGKERLQEGGRARF